MELTTNIQDCLPFGSVDFTKSGAPILPNLRRYQALVEDPVWLRGAVKYYSCALAALYLPARPGSSDR